MILMYSSRLIRVNINILVCKRLRCNSATHHGMLVFVAVPATRLHPALNNEPTAASQGAVAQRHQSLTVIQLKPAQPNSGPGSAAVSVACFSLAARCAAN